MSKLSTTVLILTIFMLSAAQASAEPRCAKDMYFDQLNSPAEKINTGFKYWIQLSRNNKTSLVDNRTSFHSGDQIRFQVIPNIAGYAYVVMVKGSTGARQVLFPNSYEPKGNVTAGKKYLLPATGYLMFDKTPGLEKVRLVISRVPVSESDLLDSTGSNSVEIKSDAKGIEPVQSANCIAAFSQAESKGVEFPLDQPANKGVDNPWSDNNSFSKDLVYVPGKRTSASRGASRIRTTHHTTSRGATSARLPATLRAGSVTVIDIEPTEKLRADIILSHIP